MNKNEISQDILIETAIADIVINDLGLTLDAPQFFPYYGLNDNIGIDSECDKYKRFYTLEAMSYHLCTLINGADLAIELAKRSGLLNCVIDDTTITEEYIENHIKDCREQLRNPDIIIGWHIEMALYYRYFFRVYYSQSLVRSDLRDTVEEKVEQYCNAINDLVIKNRIK